AQRETHLDLFADRFEILDLLTLLGAVGDPPAATLDTAEGSVHVGGVEALIEKRLPVVGRDLIERRHHVLEGVRLDRGWPRLPAVETAAEVVERVPARRELADERVGVEPDQHALVVEVGAAP